METIEEIRIKLLEGYLECSEELLGHSLNSINKQNQLIIKKQEKINSTIKFLKQKTKSKLLIDADIIYKAIEILEEEKWQTMIKKEQSLSLI